MTGNTKNSRRKKPDRRDLKFWEPQLQLRSTVACRNGLCTPNNSPLTIATKTLAARTVKLSLRGRRYLFMRGAMSPGARCRQPQPAPSRRPSRVPRSSAHQQMNNSPAGLSYGGRPGTESHELARIFALQVRRHACWGRPGYQIHIALASVWPLSSTPIRWSASGPTREARRMIADALRAGKAPPEAAIRPEGIAQRARRTVRRNAARRNPARNRQHSPHGPTTAGGGTRVVDGLHKLMLSEAPAEDPYPLDPPTRRQQPWPGSWQEAAGARCERLAATDGA